MYAMPQNNIASLSLRQVMVVHQGIVKAFEIHNNCFEGPSLMDELLKY